jgi:secondary thiamine-phosphate synthase enzyme
MQTTAPKTHLIKVNSTKAPEFIDITDQVKECFKDSGLNNGCAIVFSQHTTAAIKINETEPLLLQDMEEFIDRVSPKSREYRHNDFTIRTVNMTEDECPNGHAHCAHLLMSTSETIPVIDGELGMGPWQRIFLVELDSPRPRQVTVQFIGT